MAPEVHLKRVYRHWAGKPTIKNMSMCLRAGERVALIGPSGGGKSTLIRLIAGALRPTGGQIEVDEQDMADFTWRDIQRYRAQCRMVEQQCLLVPQSSVHNNVLSGLFATWPWYKTLRAALWPVERERVAQVLAQLGIADSQWARAGELSGGQMQRVVIARALIAHPSILLADEPTASLDPHTARAVTEQIIGAAKDRNMSLVFCTHWFDIVKKDCTRVIGVRAGEIVFDGAPSDVSHERLEDLYAGSHERL